MAQQNNFHAPKSRNRFFLLLYFIIVTIMYGESGPIFGPFEAIRINKEVIQGVKVDEEDRIWLLLNPAYRHYELKIKISSKEGSGYRKWFTGDYVLLSPANQNKAPQEWADWIQTDSKFIEYWMEGKHILHLKRLE